MSKRVTRAQRRMVVPQTEDTKKVEKNETESHPVQAEEDMSGGNVEELLVPDEMIQFMSARCPEDANRGGQVEETSCTFSQDSPVGLPDKPREEIPREQVESGKSEADQVVVHSQEKPDSEMEITPTPEDTDKGGQEQGTGTYCSIYRDSPVNVPDKPRENTLGEEDTGKSQADPLFVRLQEKSNSEMENTPVCEDTDKGGQEEETSCTINQESPADVPDKLRENTLGEDGGKSQADPVVVHSIQEEPDSEMEITPIPEDTINNESFATMPEKLTTDEFFDPKWVELLRLLPEVSDPGLELKEKEQKVGSKTQKFFLYPVPMLPLADSVKQQWEEVNKELTEDTSKVAPVRSEDSKRFWTKTNDYEKYCQSSMIDDAYCATVSHGSSIKKSFAVQDPLLHTCESNFKKCDESARMTMQASSHAVLLLNAVENILKTYPDDRKDDALRMIEGIQVALECIASSSARVVARATISRRTICMSQIHLNKPESIKKFLTLPMDTKNLFHGQFKTRIRQEERAWKKTQQLRRYLDNSSKSSEEPSAKYRKLQPPLDNRPTINKKVIAKKHHLRPPVEDPRSDYPRPAFDDREPFGGQYGPPLDPFPRYPPERIPPYPRERVPRYPHERVPRYPHERDPPYPYERVSYPYERVPPYPQEHGKYNEGHRFGSGRGRFQKGGSNFAGQKKKFKKKVQARR